MKKLSYLMIITLCVSLVSACGWRLRGSNSVDVEQSIYLAPASGKVYEQVQKTLQRKQAFASEAVADIQLVFGEEYFERRRSSVDDQARTTQYQLSLSVSYEILDQTGQPLAEKSTANLDRFFTFNQNAINSSEREEQVLRREMARQVARQILQRVNFLSRKLGETK